MTKIKDYLDGGRVLDVGGGEGRDALFLAAQGFTVEVYDLSEVGLNKIKTHALEKGLSISTKVRDVIEGGIEAEYEAVVMSFVLHHMSKADAVTVIQNAQKHTVVGGVHTIDTFMAEGELYQRNKISGRFYPSEKDVQVLYADWDIRELNFRETKSFARNKEGEQMKNMAVSLLAQKIL